MKNKFFTYFVTLFILTQTFNVYAVKNAGDYLVNRIDTNNKNYPAYTAILNLLNEKNVKVIVETGVAKGDGNLVDEKGSTFIFADWASQNGASFYSVDVSSLVVETAKRATLIYGTKMHIVQSDPIEFLKKFDKMIDFLYIDNMNLDSNNIKFSYTSHLKKIVAAFPRLHDNSIVMVNNTDSSTASNLAIKFLIARGWVILHNDSQVILIPGNDNL
ncbi:MAG: hypothetical protein Q8K60_06320 [Parachlamydiaceae bacterium]|nr:hypothetical protein [Parachlamydiaceae bacterium]